MALLGQNVEWTDTTPYAQGQPKIQRHWTARIHTIRVSIIKSRENPGRWLLHCRDIGIDTQLMAKAINENDVAAAQHFAIDAVLGFAEALKKACEES